MKVGGGNQNVWVAVHLASNDQEIWRTAGERTERMQDRTVDLSDYLGQEVYIKVVDNRTLSWGHITLDNVRQTSGKN